MNTISLTLAHASPDAHGHANMDTGVSQMVLVMQVLLVLCDMPTCLVHMAWHAVATGATGGTGATGATRATGAAVGAVAGAAGSRPWC